LADRLCILFIHRRRHPAFTNSILIAVRAGSTLQLGYSVAATKVEPHDVPAAVGFINTAPAGTGTVALTIAGSLFQNIAFENLKIACTDKNYSSRDLRSVVAGTQSDIFRSASAEVRDASIGAIINAIDKVSAMAIAAGALIFVCSIFMKREKLFVVPATGG
jgi:hypothetical protein